MDYRITAEERAAYKLCRRQWDFSSPHRQNLEPVEPPAAAVSAALREALAVYYFPGMWDWSSQIVLPLVRQAFIRAVAGQPPSAERSLNFDLGTALLERYLAWAPSLDDFGPVRVETEVEAMVPDADAPDRGLCTPDGCAVLYLDTVELLAIDAHDELWVVSHRVVDAWSDPRTLLLDERAVAACWAWEQCYLGMGVAGTIHTELLASPAGGLGSPPSATATGRPGRGGYPQHEGSGDGRGVGVPERASAVAARLTDPERTTVHTSGPVRRTHIRRGRAEIEQAGLRVATEARELLDPALSIYPSPGRHCLRCVFDAPCVALDEGADPALDLVARYRAREASRPARLGSGGRGGLLPPAP